MYSIQINDCEDSGNMNRVKVLFFANLRALAGTREMEIVLPDNILVRDARQIIFQEVPQIASAMKSTLVAVNHEFAMEDDVIPPGAEIALFPPVSGGSTANDLTITLISVEALDLDHLQEQITTPETGAVCFFSGMVRGITKRDNPHQTEYLEYEAYPEMAESKMRQIAGEIRLRWPSIQGIVIVQRIGKLQPGTPTLVIGCSAAHRDTGVFDAARYGIDRLKEIVPVWKKEVGSDGEHWVEGHYIPKPED